MKEDAPLRARPPPTMLDDYVWEWRNYGRNVVGSGAVVDRELSGRENAIIYRIYPTERMKTWVGNERISSHEGDVISTPIISYHILPCFFLNFFFFGLLNKNEIGLAAGKKQGLSEWIVQYNCNRESQRVNNSDVDRASDVLYPDQDKHLQISRRKFLPGRIVHPGGSLSCYS